MIGALFKRPNSRHEGRSHGASTMSRASALGRAAICVLMLMAALYLSAPAPASAQTLVDNVQGITIDKDGKVKRFTAILIAPDGRIQAVYESRKQQPKKVRYRIDGRGRFMLPGMIDAHAHVMAIGFAQMTLDLSETNSLAEAQAKIAEYAAKNPSSRWIVGRGWNQEKWGLGRFPTAADIDAVVADRPVWLVRVDGHAGWANSAAMAAADITSKTKAPTGGKIETIGGKPSGIFIDEATSLIADKLPKLRPVEQDLAFQKAQSLLLSKGVTAVADMGTSIEDWQTFRRAGDNRWLKMRIMAYAAGTADMQLIGGPGPTPWLYDDRLRLNGVKLYLDGALGSRGAWLKQPYADAPGETGLQLSTPSELRNRMSRAALNKFQVAVHAIGDEANAEVLSAISEMAETYKGDRRWRIEHAQVIDPADIARFGQYGIIASMQPQHQASDRVMAEARLGPQRLAGAYAWRSVAATGAKLAFGSDAPVEPPEPFLGFATAITREDANGQPIGGWQAQERVTRQQALASYTADAAYAGFAEGRFGRLLPGERADFVLVDRDPLLATPEQLRAMTVSETWVGGQRAWHNALPRSAPPNRQGPSANPNSGR